MFEQLVQQLVVKRLFAFQSFATCAKHPVFVRLEVGCNEAFDPFQCLSALVVVRDPV